ncbi:TrmB family transcriptional regulator [Escherichia coli]|uniref:TrmB family transcriptional regulator n=1 Tax=Escherichia coli TaxID=562 RepID=UPI002019EEBC|nr:TrmB family transcriptional regulator [Escherichia coli]
MWQPEFTDKTLSRKPGAVQSVTEPATVGEIAQNTYLSRERCQLILTQLVMAGLADYQCGCYRRIQS